MDSLKIKVLANYLHIQESQIRKDIGCTFFANPEVEYEDAYYVFTPEEEHTYLKTRGLENRLDLDYDDHHNILSVDGHTFYIHKMD